MSGYDQVGYLQAGADGKLEFTSFVPLFPKGLEREMIHIDPQYIPGDGFYWKNLHYLFRWREGEGVKAWVPGKADDLNQILTTLFVHKGKIWISSNVYGLFEMQGETLVQIPGGDIFHGRARSCVGRRFQTGGSC